MPKTSGIDSISSELVKMRMEEKKSAGFISGKVTRNSVRIRPAPAIRAASSKVGSVVAAAACP